MNGSSSLIVTNILLLDVLGVIAVGMLIALITRQSKLIASVNQAVEDVFGLFETDEAISGEYSDEGACLGQSVPVSAVQSSSSMAQSPASVAQTPSSAICAMPAACAAPVAQAEFASRARYVTSASFPGIQMPAVPWVEERSHASTHATALAPAPLAAHEGESSSVANAAPPSADEDARISNSQLEETRGRMERWVGRNALGVLASALVFLGLVFLGATFVPQLSDEVKVGLMFAFSTVFTVAGSALTMRRKNGFTSALMGCGTGSLFISVLVTHVYFGMIGEVAAYALILVWLVICLALVRKTESLLLSIVLQLGLSISICFGYGTASDDGLLALMLGYQLAASVIVVGGNMLFFRKMYRSSLMVAIALSIVASCFMWGYLEATPLHDLGFFGWSESQSHPIALVVVAFELQLCTVAALSVLVVKSIAESALRDAANGIDEFSMPVLGRRSSFLLLATALLWIVVVWLDMFSLLEYCASWVLQVKLQLLVSHVSQTCYAVTIALPVTLAVMAASVFVLAFYLLKCGVPMTEDALRRVLAVLLVGGACMAAVPGLFTVFTFDVVRFGWMWLWAIVAVVAHRKLGVRDYGVFALAFLAIDALYFSLMGFSSMAAHIDLAGAIALGGICVFGLCGFAGAVVRMLRVSAAGIVAFAASCTVVMMSYLYYCTPLAAQGYQWSICCMVCALVCIASGFRMRIGGLRLYGLILVIACVAKLVLLDMADLDSLVRVAALIAGGTICFAISALYNYVVRRLGDSEMKEGGSNER